MNTHTTSAQKWYRRAYIPYRAHLLCVCAAAAATLLCTTSVVNQRAHFLERSGQNNVQVRTRTQPRTVSRRAVLERRKGRLQSRIIRRQTSVAQAVRTTSDLHLLLHPAALSDTAESAQFPAMGGAIHPVQSIPHWGAMRTPQEWNRSFDELTEQDMVPVPAYDLDVLTIPLSDLLRTRNSASAIRALTAKLYYSTRHFGSYHVDSGEFEAPHPGLDLKLAAGTPIGSIAGGRVHAVRSERTGLGLHVLVEHRAPNGDTYYAIYGHLDSARVLPGQDVKPGDILGTVGTSGDATGPHVHLQVDRGRAGEEFHDVYWPSALPTRAQAQSMTVNPIEFIEQYGSH